jgi:DNA-directed RNA polymerase specialized sigma24 family protein
VKPLKHALARLDAGGSFDAFARETAQVWRGYARWLMRRWRAGSDVDEADVVQELLLGAWRGTQRFDRTRGVTIERFVVFSAIDKAKKWLHKRRNAYRRDDSSPSRIEVSFSALGLEEPEDWARLSSAPDAEEVALEHEEGEAQAASVAERFAALSRREIEVLEVVAACRGDSDAAVAVILSDPGRRLSLRIGNEAAAESAVRRATKRAAAIATGGNP